MKKIVIRVITYNQENVISRALDSVLNQKEWGLYKLIVSDDCSTDRTWEILKEYKDRYPDIVCIYRNDKNLGIYGNIAKADSYLPESDLYGNLSGDDEYCSGYFAAIQKLVLAENIDTSKPIGIFSDWKTVSPAHKVIIRKQDSVLSNYKLISLKIRGKVYSRSMLVSKPVRDKYAPMILDKGLALAEGNYDIQPHIHIENSYYIPLVTTIYYSDIGVSTRLSLKKSDFYTTQFVTKWKYFLSHYLDDVSDIHYAKYEIAKADFYIRPLWSGLLKIIYHYKKGQLSKYKDKLGTRLHLYLHLLKYKVVHK